METDDMATTDIAHWYTGPEVAKLLGISPRRVGQMRDEGKLAGVQKGKGFLYHQETIDSYLERRKRQ